MFTLYQIAFCANTKSYSLYMYMIVVWIATLYPICDFPLIRLVLHSFTPLQKSHLLYVIRRSPTCKSGMVFIPEQKVSSIVNLASQQGFSGFQVTGMIEGICWGLKFLISGNFLSRKILASIFWQLDLGRDFFGGIQNNLKIRDSSPISLLHMNKETQILHYKRFCFSCYIILKLSGNFYGSEIGHGIFWGLNFGPGILGGFDFCLHSIVPVT